MNKWVLLLIYLMVSIIYLYIWGFRTELGNYELIAVIISSTIAAVTYKKRTGKIFTVVLIITLIILAPIANSFNEKIIAEDYEKTLHRRSMKMRTKDLVQVIFMPMENFPMKK